ncbi:hypothetical protein MVEG_07107 [Podila verticillata NRRL 6337]|nr:hypothetical protein MVEG_07107 [Podila verticillata NRRL 6337]
MGATCLVHWKDANGQQSFTLLTDRLLKHFHATSLGRWTINWKVYRDTSPVSKSGTGKIMHLVHVQGGATARGVPTGSQASQSGLFTGGVAAAGTGSGPGAGLAGGAGGSGPGMAGSLGGPSLPSGVVAGSSAASVGASAKTGLGILPQGAAAGAAALAGGAGGSGLGAGGAGALNADNINTTAWCLIDDGAVAPPAATPGSNTGATMGSIGEVGQSLNKRKTVLVEVERDVEALIAKLKNQWVHRQHAQIEGYVYDAGDFIVRIGNIMVASTSYKGMLIEIEYLPQTSSATASNAILEEFVRMLSPPGANLYSPQMLDYSYDQVGLDPNHWSTLHNGFQLTQLFRRQHIL